MNKKRKAFLFFSCSTFTSFNLSLMSPWWCPWHWACKLSFYTITQRLRTAVRKKDNTGCIMSPKLNEVVSEVILCGKEVSTAISKFSFNVTWNQIWLNVDCCSKIQRPWCVLERQWWTKSSLIYLFITI